VTFIVNDYPEKTADTSAVFISGDFEGWSGGRDELKLKKRENIFSILPFQNSKNILVLNSRKVVGIGLSVMKMEAPLKTEPTVSISLMIRFIFPYRNGVL
jgi:hypothetical protein